MRTCRHLWPASCLIAVAALSACASNQPQPTGRTSAPPIINPPRSNRGNPPFYEVFGERYYILESSDGYRDAGVASWYGSDFHGRDTSSGEPYDMYAYTAAHKTLPIPTWVEVTNRRNGKSVIVKVNDRGPFVDDRLIDLSYAAANDLDMIRSGTIPVTVRALGAPASFPDEERPVATRTAADRRSAGADTGYGGEPVRPTVPAPFSATPAYVQVGAYSDIDNARRMLNRLQAAGFQNAALASGGARRPMHRVRIGPISGTAEFDRISDGLRLIGIRDAHLVVDSDNRSASGE